MNSLLGPSLIFLGAALIMAAGILASVRFYQLRPDAVKKLFRYGVILLFVFGFSVASLMIGLRIDSRHSDTYRSNLKQVQQIWGGSIKQHPPQFFYRKPHQVNYRNKETGQWESRRVQKREHVGYDSQDLHTEIKSNIRRKGLLKFAGYDMSFSGSYTIRNPLPVGKPFHFHFSLPEGAGNITNFHVQVNGQKMTQDSNLADGLQWQARLKPGETKTISVKYKAQGTGRFRYTLGQNKIALKELSYALETDFQETNIPNRAMVPTKQSADDQKTVLKWYEKDLITGQDIAVSFKIQGNYGALASELFFYAPLAMLLFTAMLVVFNGAKAIRLHPMHYLFLITGFFIFYLFGSYIVSYIKMIWGILLALALSTSLMVYYSYALGKDKALVKVVFFGALIFQWLFSLAFFFPAHTGFVITIGTIIAFTALIKATASIDWEDKL